MSTHHKCREILAELGKDGSIEYWDIPFPKVKKLDMCLGDLLEDVVDDKYYLSDKMINSFIKKDANTAFKFNPQTKDSSHSPCLTARYYKMGISDPYIKELAQVGNIDQQGHNSLWGRVYDTDGIAPTQNAKGGGAGAKTGLYIVPRRANKGVVEIDGKYYHIRRLTPREGSRVMGDFSDMFKLGDASDTKLYEFIGNAMDLSTTRNLIKTMLEFSKDFTWNEPQEPSFVKSESIQTNLFEIA